MASDNRFAGTATITVLVLEPDGLVRTPLAEYLRKCGYEVIDGAAANDVLPGVEARAKDRSRHRRSPSRPHPGRVRLGPMVHRSHPGVQG